MSDQAAAQSAQSARSRPVAAARFVYVGTYTAPDVAPGDSEPSVAEGIYVFEMDARNGDLSPVQVVRTPNPSFLALSGSQLYCVNENWEGQLSAFTVDRQRGTLSPLNSVSSEGNFPTHISVHPATGFVLAANYSSGNYVVYSTATDGQLGILRDVFLGEGNGTGANPARQEAAHAHQILTDPAGKHVFGVDLGADKVNVLHLDPGSGVLTANEVPFAPMASGSGPRHMVFHPTLPRAYVLGELTSAITVFDYDAARGAFVWVQTISTLPTRFSGTNTGGEIRIHPDGRFLYSTNRGHNSVALFEIDPVTGKLESNGWQSSGGEWPRGMNIDPSGTFLYVANQNTDNIVVFRIQRGGRLQQSALVETPTPVDIEFGALVRR